jgi:glycerol-3-phosphate dehydrogenase
MSGAGAAAAGHAASSYDVAIVGAGVIGCALARELSRYDLRTILLEAKTDLGDEASKGNSAILSTGADTPFGSLECDLVRRGYDRYLDEGPALGLPVLRVGSLTVAWNDAEAATLKEMCAAARAAGFDDVETVGADDVYERVPRLADGAVAGLWDPGECIVDPFSTPYAYALDAVENGVEHRTSSPVTTAIRGENTWHLATPTGWIDSRIAVNCGGLRADDVDALAGYGDLTIKPKQGQFIVFDKTARSLVDVIVKPVPTPSGRGILVAPTVFGNVLVGPTAEEVSDRDDRRVTGAGLAELHAAARRVIPALTEHEVTTAYAGMRPATERPEYRIIARHGERWITVAGIRSTGLSAALGVAEHVASTVVDTMLPAQKKASIKPVRVPNLEGGDGRAALDAERIARDPAYGEMVCHCERVSLGTLRDALGAVIPPRSIKALKRRTRVGFGRCQGFFCAARVEALFEAARTARPG